MPGGEVLLDGFGGATTRRVQNIHAEASVRALRRGLTDPPKSHDAHCLAGQASAQEVRRRPTFPAVVTHQPLALTGPACAHQGKQHGEIGGVVGENVRGVGDEQAGGGAGLEVDMTHACAKVAKSLGSHRPAGEHVGIDPIGNRWTDEIEVAQRVRDRDGSHRPILRVEGYVIRLGEHRFDGARPAPRQKQRGASHPRDPHTRSDGCISCQDVIC